MADLPNFKVVCFQWVNACNKDNDALLVLFLKHVHFINDYLMIYNAIQNAVVPDGWSASQNAEFQRKGTDVTMTKSLPFETYFFILMNLKLH